ncbi:iron-sulfur cluster assembly scaffold protein [Mycoplasma phocoenae]|uniref:Iron-sulfur cluster assembly scaffold protein n=1 Tax=Mycoplasma phocoenae TaxID=754517 RepID=A0A858U3Z3_9MOLU|nr:iron-sulfur cluster assembly scaffold protein [Mycoplasma phocoenae]QJG67152.1 iron-sulfur cluster assembly scaffold protein [Mycoplasma phocoenae]
MEKREIMFEHYENPKHKSNEVLSQSVEDGSITGCADTLVLSIEFENDKLTKIRWNGDGCSIFVSSVDILCEQLLNKTKIQIINIINEYEKMVKTSTLPNDIDLNKLTIFIDVKKHLNRLECALIGSRAFKRVLKIG